MNKNPSLATKIFWAVTVLCVALGAFTPMCAHAGEMHLAVGKSLPTSYTEPVGTVTAGWRGPRYGADLMWVNEHALKGQYSNGTIAAFALVSGYRHWDGKPRWWLGNARPVAIMGISAKAADRCAQQHEERCNRELPLPFAFHFGLEMQWQELRIGVYHDSNDALDYGPEKKNLGFNWVTLTYRFRK